MDLKNIVAVSGMQGLHELKSHTKNGFMVQSLDTRQVKFVTNAANRLISLDSITIYTDKEDMELKDVFGRMLEKEKEQPPVPPKSPPETLKGYFADVVPEHDEDRVYTSDIKKMVRWYHILREKKIIKPGTKKKAAKKKKSGTKKAESTKQADGAKEKGKS